MGRHGALLPLRSEQDLRGAAVVGKRGSGIVQRVQVGSEPVEYLAELAAVADGALEHGSREAQLIDRLAMFPRLVEHGSERRAGGGDVRALQPRHPLLYL